jgi:hypothetical protein
VDYTRCQRVAEWRDVGTLATCKAIGINAGVVDRGLPMEGLTPPVSFHPLGTDPEVMGISPVSSALLTSLERDIMSLPFFSASRCGYKARIVVQPPARPLTAKQSTLLSNHSRGICTSEKEAD